MKTSIALIGFMGTGKTAVGKVLAVRLGKEFIEMDSLIEQKAGMSIPQIFEQGGEISFREYEINLTKELAGRKNTVIACGGGVVLNKINIDRLKTECLVVYLTASPAVILKRTSLDKNARPLLKTPDKTTKINDLLRFRRPFYERAADITINSSQRTIDGVAKAIINTLRDNENFAG